MTFIIDDIDSFLDSNKRITESVYQTHKSPRKEEQNSFGYVTPKFKKFEDIFD